MKFDLSPETRRMILLGAAAAACAGLAFLAWRRQLDSIRTEAKREVQDEIISGASALAASADEVLARARDPE